MFGPSCKRCTLVNLLLTLMVHFELVVPISLVALIVNSPAELREALLMIRVSNPLGSFVTLKLELLVTSVSPLNQAMAGAGWQLILALSSRRVQAKKWRCHLHDFPILLSYTYIKSSNFRLFWQRTYFPQVSTNTDTEHQCKTSLLHANSFQKLLEFSLSLVFLVSGLSGRVQSHHLSPSSLVLVLVLPRQTCNEALADLTNSSLIENSAHRQFHIFPGQGQSCSLLLSFSQPAFIQWVSAGCIFTVCCSNLQRFYRISINIVGLEGGNISPSF